MSYVIGITPLFGDRQSRFSVGVLLNPVHIPIFILLSFFEDLNILNAPMRRGHVGLLGQRQGWFSCTKTTLDHRLEGVYKKLKIMLYYLKKKL
jgi:hypothetical protein